MDFPFKWSLLCEGCWGDVGRGETEGGGAATDKTRQEDRGERVWEAMQDGEREREEESGECEKDIQGQRGMDGTRLLPRRRKKKGGKSMAIAQHSA